MELHLELDRVESSQVNLTFTLKIVVSDFNRHKIAASKLTVYIKCVPKSLLTDSAVFRNYFPRKKPQKVYFLNELPIFAHNLVSLED